MSKDHVDFFQSELKHNELGLDTSGVPEFESDDEKKDDDHCWIARLDYEKLRLALMMNSDQQSVIELRLNWSDDGDCCLFRFTSCGKTVAFTDKKEAEEGVLTVSVPTTSTNGCVVEVDVRLLNANFVHGILNRHEPHFILACTPDDKDKWVIMSHESEAECRVIVGACRGDHVPKKQKLASRLVNVIGYVATHCPVQKVLWHFGPDKPFSMQFVNKCGVRSDYYLAPIQPDDDDDDNNIETETSSDDDDDDLFLS
jgi:hypothetical protein